MSVRDGGEDNKGGAAMCVGGGASVGGGGVSEKVRRGVIAKII